MLIFSTKSLKSSVYFALGANLNLEPLGYKCSVTAGARGYCIGECSSRSPGPGSTLFSLRVSGGSGGRQGLLAVLCPQGGPSSHLWPGFGFWDSARWGGLSWCPPPRGSQVQGRLASHCGTMGRGCPVDHPLLSLEPRASVSWAAAPVPAVVSVVAGCVLSVGATLGLLYWRRVKGQRSVGGRLGWGAGGRPWAASHGPSPLQGRRDPLLSGADRVQAAVSARAPSKKPDSRHLAWCGGGGAGSGKQPYPLPAHPSSATVTPSLSAFSPNKPPGSLPPPSLPLLTPSL